MSYSTYKNLGKDNNAPTEESMMFVPEIESLAQRKNVIASFPIVVVDYYTSWCGPCKIASPKFAQLAKKFSDKGVTCVKENAEHNFGDNAIIRGVPCFHFYFKGKFIPELTVTGASVDQVEKNIMKILT